MQYVDTAAYPLDRLGSQEYTQLVSRCRQDLQEHGVCRLENFVTPEGITTMQDEAGDASLEAKGNQVGRSVNAWYSSGDDTLHGTHPKNKFFDRNFGVIRDDHIRDDHAVRLVYNEPNLLRFAADVLEEPVLWQSRDAYQALTVNVMAEGEELHWHFDCNAAAITLGIQEPAAGGELEYIKDVGRENYSDLETILQTGRAPPHLKQGRYTTAAGALCFFRGQDTLHRVCPVTGPKTRLVAALQLHTTPDAFDDPLTTQRIYGVSPSEHLGPKKIVRSSNDAV